MLKIDGKCAVVLPDGQDLFSKTNKSLIAVREYLMKTCDLKKIIYLPSGMFTYTSVKTCIFYFVKKVEGTDALEIVKNISKIQKETSRDYKFIDDHQTKNVKFYKYNEENDKSELIVKVAIDTIAENSYSLNYAEYLKDDSNEKTHDNEIVMKTLGEVCEFSIGGTPSRKIDKYYKNGTNLWVSVRELNGGYIYDTKEKITNSGVRHSSVKLFEKDTILFSFKLSIGKTAIVGKPLYTNEAIAGITSKNNLILNNKYIYYHLTINDFSKLGSGIIGNGSLNKKSLGLIEIPIPPIERQEEMVKYLDFIYEKSIKSSNDKIAELKQSNELCLNNQKLYGENENKTLGEVCEIEKKIKKYDTNHGKSEGKYKFHTGGAKTDLYVDKCDIHELYIIQNRTNGGGKCNLYLDKNFSLAKQTIVYRALSGNENETKYIYYYLYHNINLLEDGFIGINQKNISKEYVKNIEIPIPSIERQQEIVDYCEQNDALIEQLKNEIEQNKKIAKQFISKIK